MHLVSALAHRPALIHHLSALAVVGLCFALLYLIGPYGNAYTPLVPFTVAITIAALIGGFRSGVLATAASALLAMYFFVPPFGSFEVSSYRFLVDPALFMLSGMMISWLADQHSRARTRSITAELQARAQLEREEHFRRIADNMAQIVWVARPDGHHEYYNHRWFEFVGDGAEDSTGDKWVDLIHPDDRAELRVRWQHALATGEDYESECRLLRSDGTYRWVLGRAKPLRDAAEDMERALAAGFDAHLAKPVEAGRLIAVVASLADRKKPGAAAADHQGSSDLPAGGTRPLRAPPPSASPAPSSRMPR